MTSTVEREVEQLVDQYVRAQLDRVARLRGRPLMHAEARQTVRESTAAWGRKYPALAWVGGVWVDTADPGLLARHLQPTSADEAEEHAADLVDALRQFERKRAS